MRNADAVKAFVNDYVQFVQANQSQIQAAEQRTTLPISTASCDRSKTIVPRPEHAIAVRPGAG
jgi:hypothetical protein